MIFCLYVLKARFPYTESLPSLQSRLKLFNDRSNCSDGSDSLKLDFHIIATIATKIANDRDGGLERYLFPIPTVLFIDF